MTPRRQGQTQKPSAPKKGQARGGGYGRGLASQTQNMRSSENTRSSGIGSGGKSWSIPLPPGPLTNPSTVLQRTIHSTLITIQQQYSPDTANLGCASSPPQWGWSAEQVRGLRLVLLDDATQMLPSELPTGKGRKYQLSRSFIRENSIIHQATISIA